jgi:DNA-binding response OmpR family regulator
MLVPIESSILSGKRVLIVEDEMLVALLIETFLTDWGCVTAGPYSSVAKALEEVESAEFDLAILDVNLGNEKSYPIAEVLDSRGTPFLFLSGYGKQAIPLAHPTWMVCAKPFSEEELAERLVAVLTPSS